MKLAWLCWESSWIEDDEGPIILFEKPEEYVYTKIIPIVYMEIVT